MPAPVIIKVGAIVVTAVVAGGVIIYNLPEVQQFAHNCRRRIAVTLQSIADDLIPEHERRSSNPRFNRPEDAEGFMQSAAVAGLDGDEESRRRQREELMYWNQVRLEKQEAEARKLSLLDQDRNVSDRQTSDSRAIYNSGAVTAPEGIKHRSRTKTDVYGNPFADENRNNDGHQIEMRSTVSYEHMTPEPSVAETDIYGIEDIVPRANAQAHQNNANNEKQTPANNNTMLDTGANWTQDMHTSIAEAHPDAYASIAAWAEHSTSSQASEFYTPVPNTSEAAGSIAPDFELVSGINTPVDSLSSYAGSGILDMESGYGGDRERDDVLSDSEGISTPGTWTEVGSVASAEEFNSHEV